MKKLSLLCLCLGFAFCCNAQELNCKVQVILGAVQGVDPKVFKALEQGIQDFVNNKKWSNDNFDIKEKIECVYTLVITKKVDNTDDTYSGKLSIQATRPVFGTNYKSTMVNYSDKDVTFKYVQFQAFEFNDNRVAGDDPLTSNLTALIAYYSYMILGIDYDSFALKGGTDFYTRAQNIVNNAPEQKLITGWKATENQRNRFWLVDQISNNRFTNMRTLLYKYHRLGLDLLTTEPETARLTINGLFTVLQQVNADNPSSILMQFFFNAKSDEIQNYLAKSSLEDKQKFVPILSLLDVSNASKYAELLKNK